MKGESVDYTLCQVLRALGIEAKQATAYPKTEVYNAITTLAILTYVPS